MTKIYNAPPHHACILSAFNREEGLSAARAMAASALCRSGKGKACGLCRDCRKIKEDIHPDVQFVRALVDDKGREKREISVDQVRKLSADACLLPNEAEGKVYIIDQADRMNQQAQNAALKLLEEPQKGVVLLLCTANPGKLLPTVRSRCVEILCNEAAPAETQSEQDSIALEYLEKVARGDAAALCGFCFARDNMSTQELEAFLRRAFELTAEMLCRRRDSLGMSRRQLLALTELLERCIGYSKVNTGVKHIFGLLAARSICGNER